MSHNESWSLVVAGWSVGWASISIPKAFLAFAFGDALLWVVSFASLLDCGVNQEMNQKLAR